MVLNGLPTDLVLEYIWLCAESFRISSTSLAGASKMSKFRHIIFVIYLKHTFNCYNRVAALKHWGGHHHEGQEPGCQVSCCEYHAELNTYISDAKGSGESLVLIMCGGDLARAN